MTEGDNRPHAQIDIVGLGRVQGAHGLEDFSAEPGVVITGAEAVENIADHIGDHCVLLGQVAMLRGGKFNQGDQIQRQFSLDQNP